jgi:hypothetical protein
MHSRLFSLLALVCLSSALYAQKEKPENHQVYGGYSFLSNSLNGVPGARQGLNGFDAGIAFTPWHNLRFKIDTSAYRGTNLGAPQHPYFIMGGGQYNFRIGRETLFAEGLAGVGGANKNWGTGGSLSQTASRCASRAASSTRTSPCRAPRRFIRIVFRGCPLTSGACRRGRSSSSSPLFSQSLKRVAPISRSAVLRAYRPSEILPDLEFRGFAQSVRTAGRTV